MKLSETARKFINLITRSWSHGNQSPVETPLLNRIKTSVNNQDQPVVETQLLALIKNIVNTGELTSIPTLYNLISDQRCNIRTAAFTALTQILDQCQPIDLAHVDNTVRELGDWRFSSIDPDKATQLASGMVHILGLLSFSPDGYVRASAIQELAKLDDGRELPYLIIRLNDWVPPVRILASDAVYQRLTINYVPRLVQSLPLIKRLENQSRTDHKPIIVTIQNLIKQVEAQPALQQALSSPDPQTRHLAMHMILQTPDLAPEFILTTGLESKDPYLRFLAAKFLRPRLDTDQLTSMLAQIRYDRSKNVRLESLYGYVEKLPEKAPDILNTFLLDPSLSIREAARFHLRHLAITNFADFYRTQIKHRTGIPLAAAIAGLGETGTSEDGALIIPKLNDPNPRVRLGTVKALGRLDVKKYQMEILSALSDPISRISTAACIILSHHSFSITAENIWNYYLHAPNNIVKSRTLRVIAALPWWDSSWMLLTALGDSEATIQTEAHNYLLIHSSGSFSTPTPAQLSAYEQALSQYGHLLQKSLRNLLTETFKYRAGRTITFLHIK